MDRTTQEETEAFYNDIPLPTVTPIDACVTSDKSVSPFKPGLLLRDAGSRAADAQQLQQKAVAGKSSRSSGATVPEKNTLPGNGGSPSDANSDSGTRTYLTGMPFSGNAAKESSAAGGDTASLLQRQYRDISYFTAVPAAEAAPGTTTASEASFSLPPHAGAAVGGGARDLPRAADPLQQQQRNELHTAGETEYFVPPGTRTTLATDYNNAAPGRASSGGVAPGELPISVCSQVHAFYLATRRRVFARTASWRDFCQLSSFERPATGAAAIDRVERNVRFFFMNYVMLCTALIVLATMISPVILVVGAVFGSAAAAAGLYGGSAIRLGEGTVVPMKNIRYGCAAAGLLTLLLFAGQVVVGVLVGSAVLVLLHAVLHVGVSYEKIAQQRADDFDCAV